MNKNKRGFMSYGKDMLLLCVLVIVCLLAQSIPQKSIAAGPTLRFSEIVTSNEQTLSLGDNFPDWVEIENTGDTAVSLNGISILCDERYDRIFTFPSSTLEAGGRVVVYADDGISRSGEHHAQFRLPSGGTTLVLFDKANSVLDSVDVPTLESDSAYCRDDKGGWTVTYAPTPEERNRLCAENEIAAESFADSQSSAVIISEIMASNNAYSPAEDGQFYDYVEIANSSDRDVDLSGWYLTDDIRDMRKWAFPNVSLSAGGFLTVRCSGLNNGLHTSFKLSEGETVSLINPEGKITASVVIPSLEAGEAYSYVGDKWTTSIGATPNAENTVVAAKRCSMEILARSRSPIAISEIVTESEDVDFEWVEIRNYGTESVDIGNYGLSDNLSTPRKWQFPADTVLGAGETTIVCFVGKDGKTNSNYHCAKFSISSDSGTHICLSSPQGEILDVICLETQYLDASYGRDSNMSIGYLETVTPDAENVGASLNGRCAAVQASVAGGLYTSGDAFSVSLSAQPNSRIYYTLDCSDPTEASTLYDGRPISVSGTTILRTRAYLDGYLPSLMDTQSYLYDIPNAGDVAYVVSLVSDPVGLFSDETGIMVKGLHPYKSFPYGANGSGANFWMDWEREAHLELFSAANGTAISQECGIKIHGRNSRGYELKSLKLIARERYGDALFNYPLFTNYPYTSYKSLILRYTGQDYKYTFMRDPVFTRLAGDSDLIYQESELCVYYLNGEYYSAMYLRSNIDLYEICQERGWSIDDDIDLVKSGSQVVNGSNQDYVDMKEWLTSHDTSTQEAYEYIDRKVDIDNFLDYCTFIIILGTPDTVNVKRYRNNSIDSKWRWCVYDIDRCLRENIDGFALLAQGTNAQLFNACINNTAIRDRLIERLDTALAENYSPEKLQNMVVDQYTLLKPVLPDYLNLVGVSQHDYNSYVKTLLKIIAKRPGQVLSACQKTFGFSNEEMIERFGKTRVALSNFTSVVD